MEIREIWGEAIDYLEEATTLMTKEGVEVPAVITNVIKMADAE